MLRGELARLETEKTSYIRWVPAYLVALGKPCWVDGQAQPRPVPALPPSTPRTRGVAHAEFLSHPPCTPPCLPQGAEARQGRGGQPLLRLPCAAQPLPADEPAGAGRLLRGLQGGWVGWVGCVV